MAKRIKYCCVIGCPSTSTDVQTNALFKLPSKIDRRIQWLHRIGRMDLKDMNPHHYNVCQLHFYKNDFILCSNGEKLLKPLAIPFQRETEYTGPIICKTEPKDEPPVQTKPDTRNSETQVYTTTYGCKRIAGRRLTDTPPSSRQRELLENENESESFFITLCHKYLSKDIAELVKAQHYLENNTNQRHRLDFKLICLDLFYTSPQCYRIMENLIDLPKSNTLNKINIKVGTGIDEELIRILKLKVENMSDSEKQCSVVVGMMDLKPNVYYDISHDKILGFEEIKEEQHSKPANKAVVLVVQGLLAKWMQPVAYGFISQLKKNEKVTKWIHDILAKLFDIGLSVRAYVSNHELDFIYKNNNNSIRADQPFFTVMTNKVYHIYDVPRLMNLFRNNFLVFNLRFYETCIAKFVDISKFYENEKLRSHKLNNKLTDRHIKPSDSQKAEVRYAVELFSQSVATGISTYVDFKALDESARGTARLVQLMNDLFDILNSSTIRHDCKYKRAYSGADFQTEFLTKIIIFFRSLEFVRPGSGKSLQVALSRQIVYFFLTTIRATMFLYDDLKKEGFEHLFTRRLNQEIVDELFSTIRSGTWSEAPTSRQFASAFKKLCFKNILLAPPKKENIREAMTRFFLRLTDFLNVHEERQTQIEYYSLCSITRDEYNQIVIPKEQPLMYVCGWLLMKCVAEHKFCDDLIPYTDVNRHFHNQKAKTRFLRYREYLNEVKSDLPVPPPDDFITYVERMENMFIETFETPHCANKIGNAIYEKIQLIPFITPPPCPCFPKDYLQKLFVRMRLFTRMKYYATVIKSKPYEGLKYLILREPLNK